MALLPARPNGTLSRPESQPPACWYLPAESEDLYQRMGQLMSGASDGGWQRPRRVKGSKRAMDDSLITGVRPGVRVCDHHRGRGNRHLHRGVAARPAVHPGRRRPSADRRPGPGYLPRRGRARRAGWPGPDLRLARTPADALKDMPAAPDPAARPLQPILPRQPATSCSPAPRCEQAGRLDHHINRLHRHL